MSRHSSFGKNCFPFGSLLAEFRCRSFRCCSHLSHSNPSYQCMFQNTLSERSNPEVFQWRWLNKGRIGRYLKASSYMSFTNLSFWNRVNPSRSKSGFVDTSWTWRLQVEYTMWPPASVQSIAFFGRLGRRILGDDSSSAAWSVQQDATVSLSDLRPFPNQYSGRALLVSTIAFTVQEKKRIQQVWSNNGQK